MTLNPRIVLVCATCIIISGFIGSYKSYQIYKDQIIDSQIVKSKTVAEFAGQNIEQKLSQIEASVSYLDQSTVETLKRFGVRYFAYAYDKKGEWSIKWKVLGEMGKEAILSEVKPLPFADLSEKARHWARSTDNQLIYITPVALAESHQLKEGFLVFGIQPEFFSSLKNANDTFMLVDSKQAEVFGSLPTYLADKKNFFSQDDSSPQHFEIESEVGTEITTASFLPRSQLWILRQDALAPLSFFGSRFFTYFLFTSGIGLLLLVLMLLGRGQKHGAEALTRRPLQNALGQLASAISGVRLRLQRPYSDGQSLDEESGEEATTSDLQKVEDFGDFLDHVIADEASRLQKVGVSIKTQVEEGAAVICSPQRVTDFIKRLIGNSVLSLDGEEDKEIQIQVVEQLQSYQLIYVDTRTDHFPSREPISLMAQTEGSLQGIDGIIAYAGWLFGDRLTVAKKGFCLSIDLPKPGKVTAAASAPEPLSVIPLQETIERIEIDDSDTDLDLISGFKSLEPAKKEDVTLSTSGAEELSLEEPKVNFDDVIDQFRMKSFGFNSEDPQKVRQQAVKEATLSEVDEAALFEEFDDVTGDEKVELKKDDNGLFEFNSGQFKIKIRSPKKRDGDVSN